uniref:NADH dehydrogenase subunit 4L n=1 Tax=Compsopogon caeruleus TaxID=31354 RepID=A0A1Z1XBI5_9RHOD|nr:NADH dehydrogenase subunit 4L [Compsopogon caeruleus]ARX96185.1 NADH dehydrogenase subunit 4L [Compsopogon caeruleus]
MLSPSYFLSIILILFLVGILGILFNRKNIILILMSIELLLLAINFNWVFFSFYLDDIIGQIFAILVLTVAASETAIGLALLVIYYRIRGNISIELANLIGG